MNIVTSICVDEDESDHAINYPSTLDASSSQRRLIYWKCVAVFFASSIRCNPDARHLLYTNDKQPVISRGANIKDFLIGLGVDIQYVPFVRFKPPAGYSDAFKNAFYKLDVMHQLGQLAGTHSILLDSDCIWTKPNPQLVNDVESDTVLLYDVYQSHLGRKDIHHTKRLSLGKLYKELHPYYPVIEPTQFGGELVAASSENFKVISDKLQEVYTYIITHYKVGPPKVDASSSIFDGDEYLSSMVYNNMPVKWKNAKDYIRRIWNTLRYSSTLPSDLNLVIWHMPSEKTQGIPMLYKEIINKQSEFWQVPLPEFTVYLGKYLGVPQHVVSKRYGMLFFKTVQAIVRKVKKPRKSVKK